MTRQSRPLPIHTVGTIERSRRLLLISFHFPPGQSVGALRWQKLSHFAAERGWAIDVITLDPSCLDASDASRLADLPPGTRIFAVPAGRLPVERVARAVWNLWRRFRSRSRRHVDAVPLSNGAAHAHEFRPSSLSREQVRWELGRGRGLVRAFFAWQDHASSGRWARQAAALAVRVIDPAVHVAVVTSGPPHMTHEAGRLVAQASGLPFVMDMRDPWSLSERLHEFSASPIWYSLARRHERRAVERAAVIVANTDAARRALCRAYPQAAHRTITVMNGCDDEPIPPSRHGRRFVVAFAGAIYLERDPRTLFRAAARVGEELRLEPSDFSIELMGHVDQYGAASVANIAREEGVEQFVTITPPRPRREVMEFLARAAMLVSLPLGDNLTVPAKLFEYVRFDAWILALAEQASPTASLLKHTDADIVDPDDLDGITAVLRKRYSEYSRGIRPTAIAANGRFSRRRQAEILFDAIGKCTDGTARSVEAASTVH